MNVTFFFPYPHISGIPVLFSNIANYLVKNSHYTIYIIDYENGALINNCIRHERLIFKPFYDFKKCYINYETFLILQAGPPYKLRKELIINSNNIKIIEWSAYEFNLIPFLSKFKFIRNLQIASTNFYKFSNLFNISKIKNTKNWIDFLISKKAIHFMTNHIYETPKKFLNLDENLTPSFIPNFSFGELIFDKNLIKKKSIEAKLILNLAWVGRIVDFKVHILNYSLKSLSKYSEKNKRKIFFHIIGDGPAHRLIEFNCSNSFFKIINVGRLNKNKIDNYLQENIHSVFAMGTSAIDAARLGLPVILLDQSLIKIRKDYVFRYLFEATGFDLGHPLIKSDFICNNNSIDIIINDLSNKYVEVGIKCYDHFKNNHSIEIVIKKLLKSLKNKNYYTIDEVPKNMRIQGFFRLLYLLYVQYIKKKYY